MEFTIKRSCWIRGQGSDVSRLVTEDGQKCCLGFFGNALGLSDEQMYDIELPSHVDGYVCHPDGEFLHEHVPESDYKETLFASVNDDVNLTDEEREERLTKMFAEYGHKVIFED